MGVGDLETAAEPLGGRMAPDERANAPAVRRPDLPEVANHMAVPLLEELLDALLEPLRRAASDQRFLGSQDEWASRHLLCFRGMWATITRCQHSACGARLQAGHLQIFKRNVAPTPDVSARSGTGVATRRSVQSTHRQKLGKQAEDLASRELAVAGLPDPATPLPHQMREKSTSSRATEIRSCSWRCGRGRGRTTDRPRSRSRPGRNGG